jgi:hypothetical protein
VEDDRALLRRMDFLPVHVHADESESLLEYPGLLRPFFFIEVAAVLSHL